MPALKDIEYKEINGITRRNETYSKTGRNNA